MKVKELIKELEECNGEYEVVMTFEGESGRSFNYYVGEGCSVDEEEEYEVEECDDVDWEGKVYKNVVVIGGSGDICGCQ